MSRTPLEDPPSISEGCGGRVTDYRINVSGTDQEVLLVASIGVGGGGGGGWNGMKKIDFRSKNPNTDCFKGMQP